MRPIDADALKELIDFRMWDVDDDYPHDEASNRISEDHAVKKIIDEMPTVDAVPVIRCKDCTYWDSEITQTAVPNMRSCIYWGRIGTLGIDYCSRAVRKEE